VISTSPLRYPGGKARFTDWIWRSIEHSGGEPQLFAEPFCGGCGVAIALLKRRAVREIALNDADPLVASFWQVVFGKSKKNRADINWLISQIEESPLDITTWRGVKASIPGSIREAAFKCLYLNRTSFNGIIYQSGPIGGWGQIKNTLGVRFNRPKLINRINELYELRDHVVEVSCVDWKPFCESVRTRPGVYLYLDPPFFHKANQLYGMAFDEREHERLRDYLSVLDSPWMLSYDDAPEVRSLYSNDSGIAGVVVDQTYSAHPVGGASFVGRELFFSNRKLPKAKRRVRIQPTDFLSRRTAVLGMTRTGKSNTVKTTVSAVALH